MQLLGKAKVLSTYQHLSCTYKQGVSWSPWMWHILLNSCKLQQKKTRKRKINHSILSYSVILNKRSQFLNMYPQCMFGMDCPFHRLLCSLCHGQREQVQLPLVNWHISMNVQGEPMFWAYDIHWRRYRICKMHFLQNFGLEEADILKLYKTERRMRA